MAEVLLQGVSKSYDGQHLAVQRLDLRCPQGEMLALLGPSGCGKSSTLKMVAGIEAVSAGRILFDGVNVTALDSAARNVAMVFEDYALYPHLSAFENIAFPLRVRGVPGAQVQRRVQQVIDMLGLGQLLKEPVRSLSGGAQQRVSIGRALVREPALVMFDEPLSHLDADQKVVLRTEIRRLQASAGLTSVLVTHDQTEAMAMADRIAVMDQGVLQQVGTPAQLYGQPANRFVAGFIGDTPMNFLPARADTGGVLLVGLPGAPALALAGPWGPAADLLVGIRPEDLGTGAPPPGQAGLHLQVQVIDRECCGDRDVLLVACGQAHLHLELPAPCGLQRHDTVPCWLPADRVHVFDAASGVALAHGATPC